jgi:hypothetical protein
MHYLPDTNDEDAVQERYWPDSYKPVIRREVHKAISQALDAKALCHVFERRYSRDFSEIGQFIEFVIGGIIIGAENGADNGFEIAYASFLSESPLPELPKCRRALWPGDLSQSSLKSMRAAIIGDYRTDDGFVYAYRDGYKGDYGSIDGFLDKVADIILIETANGVSATLGKYYRAFILGWPLPPMRRNPRRLKTW